MAGATIVARLDAAEAQRQLARAAAAWGNPVPILRAIGRGMVANVDRRFQIGMDPQGQPWAALHPAYEAGKRNIRILQESGALVQSIHHDVAGNELAIGTDRRYAAVHQFGATIRPRKGPYLVFRMAGAMVKARQVTIPARPYLGIGDEDEETVLEVAEAFLDRAMRR